MLKMTRDENTVLIIKDKNNDFKVVNAFHRDGKMKYKQIIYSGKIYSIDDVLHIFKNRGYIEYETPEEWNYKYDRMC